MSKESKTYKNMPKKVYIRTFGCQMNDRDAELIYGLLAKDGYLKALIPEEADVLLFNTCSVRKHAEDRVYGQVGQLRKWKKENPSKILGIVGCMAQSHKEKIFDSLPHVDFICGPSNIYDIPELILKKTAQSQKRYIQALDKDVRPDLEQPSARDNPVTDYVSISEGCDNYCSYCIVPYVRGRERSRSKKIILDEVRSLADSGAKEVMLLGQNVNSYQNTKHNSKGFVDLLEEINKIKGIERIRFATSHPKDATEALFKAMRDLSKVCEHLHLPLQSGSDQVLQRMNRSYTYDKYMDAVESYRSIVPGSSLTTDIIVGFPGESDEDFKSTFRAMKEIGFDNAFIFKYSPRPPAESSEYKDDIPKEAKEERNRMLLGLQRETSRRVNERCVGRTLEVLVDTENKKAKGKTLCSRTRTNKIAVFDGGLDLINRFVNVRIQKVTPNTLIGELEGQ